jgi:hypothetical protein
MGSTRIFFDVLMMIRMMMMMMIQTRKYLQVGIMARKHSDILKARYIASDQLGYSSKKLK